MIKKLFLLVGLLLCMSSGHAHIQTYDQTKVQSCDMIDAYDDHLIEINGTSNEAIDSQAMIDVCQYALSKKPNEIRYIYQLAQAYYNHNDYVQAYNYYRQAAEQGYAPAQQSLGKLYRMGKGVA